MVGKNKKKIGRQQKFFQSLNKIQKKLKESISCFGDALVSETDMLKGG